MTPERRLAKLEILARRARYRCPRYDFDLSRVTPEEVEEMDDIAAAVERAQRRGLVGEDIEAVLTKRQRARLDYFNDVVAVVELPEA